MKILREEASVRDQGESPFRAILARLCGASGALAAALVDSEGETVDYAGRVAPFDLRVAAAEWRLVLSALQSASLPAWRRTEEVLIRCAERSFAVWVLSDGYALVLVLPRYAFRTSRRALAQATHELEREAGLSHKALREAWRWQRVQVRTVQGDDRRPAAVWYDGAWRFVTILGRVQAMDLDAEEVGYLTRFMVGPEMVLVREAFGKWFAGDAP